MKPFRCYIRRHRWERVRLIRVGATVSWHWTIVPAYRMQERCACCGKHRLKRGLYLLPFWARPCDRDESGWPLDENGTRLPAAVDE